MYRLAITSIFPKFRLYKFGSAMSSPNVTNRTRPIVTAATDIVILTIHSASSVINADICPSRYPIMAYVNAFSPNGVAR